MKQVWDNADGCSWWRFTLVRLQDQEIFRCRGYRIFTPGQRLEELTTCLEWLSEQPGADEKGEKRTLHTAATCSNNHDNRWAHTGLSMEIRYRLEGLCVLHYNYSEANNKQRIQINEIFKHAWVGSPCWTLIGQFQPFSGVGEVWGRSANGGEA